MATKKLGIGIAGLGNIAATHANAIRGVEHAVLVGGCSRSSDSRNAFAGSFGVPCDASYEDFLKREELDAVTICTPSGTHLDYGKQAAEAGKHLIVEKPIEINVKRGRELIDCCKQNGVQLAVIYQSRFMESVIRMKQALDDGVVGKPVMARASVKWFRAQEYYSGSGWRGTLDLDGGGAVINQSIHTVDLLVWMMGDVKQMSGLKATLTHPGIEAEDNAVAVVEFANGALGVFEASTSIVPAQPRSIEINGTGGTLVLKDDSFRLITSDEESDGDEAGKQEGTGAEDPLAGMTAGHHQKQYEQIVEAIRTGGEPRVSGEESLQSLAFVEALYTSSDLGKPVQPADILKQTQTG